MRVNLEARAAAAEQRRAKTRERLLDAASAVIAEKGPDATSIEEIVAAAGVSRGTFYNYFPTTDDLVSALNLRSTEVFLAPMAELISTLSDPASRLAATAHFTIQTMIADPTRAWVILRLEGSRTQSSTDAVKFLNRLFRDGAAAGQFHEVNLDAARTMTVGALRSAARDMLMAGAPDDLPLHVITMVLCALGMPRAEAERVSRHSHAYAADFCARVA